MGTKFYCDDCGAELTDPRQLVTLTKLDQPRESYDAICGECYPGPPPDKFSARAATPRTDAR